MKNIHILPTPKDFEVWRDVIGYEGLDQVSNFGNVKSLGNEFSRKERILKPLVQSKGYINIVLQKDGKRKMVLMHRLVAEYFISNPDNKLQINHINGIKIDNRVENLEWVSHRENLDHAIENNLVLKGELNPTSKLKTADVLEIHKLLSFGITVDALSKKYKVSKETISGIKSRRYWKHLDLPKIEGRASKTTLSDILKIEELLKEERTINNIHEITGFSAGLINKVKNGEYNKIRDIYEKFAQETAYNRNDAE